MSLGCNKRELVVKEIIRIEEEAVLTLEVLDNLRKVRLMDLWLREENEVRRGLSSKMTERVDIPLDPFNVPNQGGKTRKSIRVN